MASARKPTIKSNLGMGFPRSRSGLRGYFATVARVARSLAWGKGRNDASQLSNVVIRQGTKKPRTMPGLLSCLVQQRSVLRDERATPIEVVGQLAADGVDEVFGVDRRAERRARWDSPKHIGRGVEFREAVFGLPEQAGQEVQCILVACTQEPTLVRPLVKENRGRCRRKVDTGEINPIKGGLSITSRKTREKAWQRHPANAATDRPGRTHLLLANTANKRAHVGLETAEIIVPECADHKAGAHRRKLIVAAGLHRSKVTPTALSRRLGDLGPGRTIGEEGVFLVPQPIAAPAADVAAGPGRSICNGRGGLRIGTGGQISRDGRSGECRRCGQCEHQFFHLNSSGKVFGPDRLIRARGTDSKINSGTIAGSVQNTVAGRAHVKQLRGLFGNAWVQRHKKSPGRCRGF